jgi:hypothetical protein
MKKKQKSCQNEPSTGRFDGLPTRFDGVKTKPKESHFCLMFGLKTNAMRCLSPSAAAARYIGLVTFSS